MLKIDLAAPPPAPKLLAKNLAGSVKKSLREVNKANINSKKPPRYIANLGIPLLYLLCSFMPSIDAFLNLSSFLYSNCCCSFSSSNSPSTTTPPP